MIEVVLFDFIKCLGYCLENSFEGNSLYFDDDIILY